MNSRLQRIVDRARAAEDVLSTPENELSPESKAVAERLMAPGGRFDLADRYRDMERSSSRSSGGLASGLRLALEIGFPAAAQRLNATDRSPAVDSKTIAQRLMAPGGPFCLERVFADMLSAEAPSPTAAPQIIRQPRLRQLEKAFLGLSADERDDEITRHVWAEKDPSRPKTVWSDLLSSWDVGNDNVVSDSRKA